MEKANKLGLNEILEEIKSGSSPAKICKKYKIPKQTLDYSVSKLKKLGCIEKKGYGVWDYIKEVPIVLEDTRKGNSDFKKQIRGHAFIWKIKFYNPILWEQKLKKSKIKYSLICRNKVFRILFQNRKIWLTKDGMIIYEPIDFMGDSSFQVKGMAVHNMDKIIKNILKKLRIPVQKYKFTTSREHYGIVRNELARQYNERKEKMQIKSEDGTVWLWIDDSLSLGELETAEPVVNRQLQQFWNDHKRTGFQMTATKIQENFTKVENEIVNLNGVFPAMEEYNINLKLHIKVQQEQLKTQKATQELLKKIGEKLN